MTIDEQLREIARHADEHQRPITVDEIVQRASGQDLTLSVARPPDRRWRAVAVAAAVAVIVAMGVTVIQNRDRAPEVTTTPDPTVPDIFTDIPPGSTVELPPGPLSEREFPVVVWSGTEMIVWGDGREMVDDGAAFNPSTGSWRVITPAPIEGRFGPHVTWTGTEMIVVGGFQQSGGGQHVDLRDGAAYNPTTDTWRRLPEAPFLLADRGVRVWTGDEVIVLGARAAAYSPETNEWRRLANWPADLLTRDIVWTGETLLLTAEARHPEATDQPFPLLRYDGRAEEWHTVDGAGSYTTLVAVPDGDGGARAVLALPDELGAPVAVLDRAGNVTGTLPGHPGDRAILDPIEGDAVWVGEEALFWFWDRSTVPNPREAWALNPETGTWRQLDEDAPPQGADLELVAGAGVLVGWGSPAGGDVSTGIAYRAP